MLELIFALALYEKAPAEVVITLEQITDHFFGVNPKFIVMLWKSMGR